MIMQTAFFVISGILPKDEAIRAIKKCRLRRLTARRERSWFKMNKAAVDRALQNIVEVPVPGKVTSTKKRQPAVPADAPEFVRQVTARIISGQGRFPACFRDTGRRHLADRHHPVREEKHRGAYSGLGAGYLHSVRPVFFCLPPRDNPDEGLRPGPTERRSEGFQGHRMPRVKNCKGSSSRFRSPPKTAPAALHASLPALQLEGMLRARREKDSRPSICGRSCHSARRRRRITGSSLDLPETDPTRYNIASRQRKSVRPASFRIQRGLCRLWRNPVYQAPDPTLRRPPLHRQRHGLLLHLWRKPAHYSLHEKGSGRGPAWSNSLFEDAAEFALGMRLTVDDVP